MEGRSLARWRTQGKKRKRKMRNRTQAEEVVSILQSQRETESDSQSFWDARGGPCIIGELAEAWGNTYGGLRAERTQKTDRASLVFASPMWAGAAFMGLA